MKKKKTPKLPPIFRKEKEMIKFLNDPDGVKRLIQLTEKTQEIKPIELKKATSLVDWMTMCIPFLPDDFVGTDFSTELALLVEKYEDNNKEQ